MAGGSGRGDDVLRAGRLILMGSGETSNRLVAAHRLGLERAGAKTALVLDTPYGFQENAALISRKIARFFETSLAVATQTVSYPSTKAGAVAREEMLAAVRRGRYVFAGPGSPSYALEVWQETALARTLRNLLSTGGTVTFASAAALTAGVRTLPVYEIFKAGAPPEWLKGLDLTSHLGLEAVFVPHWNNTEGQGFDTSRCYVGRRRFGLLRAKLPPKLGVIGVDEHTAAIVDFSRKELSVVGLGGVTLQGENDTVLGDGESMGLGAVFETLAGDRPPSSTRPQTSPSTFQAALDSRSARKIATVLLKVESKAAQGSEDARRELREMLLETSKLAAAGLVKRSEWVGDSVALLVQMRSDLRTQKRWEEADRIRSSLELMGVKLRDTPSGTKWILTQEGNRG
jgi:cyanophycinase-like exopeptidase